MSVSPELWPRIRESYAKYTLDGNIRNSKVACMLVVVLMPIGYLMDMRVYSEHADQLLRLRLMTSALAALVFVALCVPNLPSWAYRVLCTGWYVVPAFFISWMIYATKGVVSSYYA